ncbi:MAG: hypothetical protein JWQ88_3806, partial [Rhodoferax sp.]|nr:hypothetical protein [Rhodoferax sp.]
MRVRKCPTPFVLSLSKPSALVPSHFDKLSANGLGYESAEMPHPVRAEP